MTLEEISNIENGDNNVDAILKAVSVKLKSFLDRISSETEKNLVRYKTYFRWS